ncbi:hypothetical protein L249_3523 [Ophiocordyceps polyrhachis-furcata BCC 54312]|uniref:Uncharacterized protein n=1 Tax=Ophiocordyceps polyrhachis-furcata BCC 54312 TaxID=1330021 RepID=A0A367LMM1_9HYPO|nr:hypothetical protein L249_3523 [Ophiocordyceps polyrhachis-furcata BCC 54312]
MRASILSLLLAACIANVANVAAQPRAQRKAKYSVVPLEPEDEDVTIVQTVVKTERPVTHVITSTPKPATVTVTTGTTQTVRLPESPTSTMASGYSFGPSSSPCCPEPAVQTVTLVASVFGDGVGVGVRPSVMVLTVARPFPSTTLATSRIPSMLSPSSFRPPPAPSSSSSSSPSWNGTKII